MGCEASLCNKTSTPSGIFIVTPILDGQPTKVKEAPSPHEVRLTLLDTNSVFQCLGGKCSILFQQHSMYATFFIYSLLIYL